MISLYIHTTTHAIGQAFGLLKNLLEHKVGITTFLYLTKIDIYCLDLRLLFLT